MTTACTQVLLPTLAAVAVRGMKLSGASVLLKSGVTKLCCHQAGKHCGSVCMIVWLARDPYLLSLRSSSHTATSSCLLALSCACSKAAKQ